MKTRRLGLLSAVLAALVLVGGTCARHEEQPAEPQVGIQRNVHLIIDSELDKSGWTPEFKRYVESDGNVLFSMAHISLAVASAHAMEIPHDGSVWSESKQAEFAKQISKDYSEYKGIKLVLLPSTVSGGRTYLSDGVVVCGVDATEGKITSRLVLHEIMHLFGAIDLTIPNHIMNQDSLHTDTRLEFDEDTITIMQLAREDIQASGAASLTLSSASPAIANRIIPHLHNLLPVARYPYDVHTEIAGYHEKHQRYGEALAEYRAALACAERVHGATQTLKRDGISSPSSRDEHSIYDRIGLCLIALNRYGEAIETLTRAVTLGDDDAPTNFLLGLAYLQSEKYEIAAVHLQRCVELDPKHAMGWDSLGLAYDRMQDKKRAVEAFQRYVELNPENSQGWYNLGTTCADLKDMQRAAEAFLHCVELDPKNRDGWFKLGAVLGSLEEAELAEEIFRHCVELNPNNSSVWYNLGISYNKLKDVNRAVEAFQRCVELDPDNSDGWYRLGALYAELKDMDRLAETLQRYLELRPDDSQGWQNLALALADTVPIHDWQDPRIERTKDALRKVIELNPENGTAHHMLAIILQNQGLDGEAVEHLSLAEKLGTNRDATLGKRGGGVKACWPE